MEIKGDFKMDIDNKIIELNNAFTDIILKSCKGKQRILTTLTAGMDTRVILSILLNNGIVPQCLTYNGWNNYGSFKDIKISNMITRDYQLVHIVINKQPCDDNFYSELYNILGNYDVALCGEKMSEILNKYNRITDSERKLNNLEISSIDFPNKLYPVLDKEVLNIIMNIPICYRMHGFLQRKLIDMNCKGLLHYPHTYYNIRYAVMENVCKLLFKMKGSE